MRSRILSAMSIMAVALLFGGRAAHAFPEMARFGYTNCATCHYSPNGGGLLTPYGRALSKEVLSNGKFFFEYWFEKNKTEAPKGEAGKAPAATPEEKEAAAPAAGAPKGSAASGGGGEEVSREPMFLYGAFDMPEWMDLGMFFRGLMLYLNNPSFAQLTYVPMQTDIEGEVTFWRIRADASFGPDWYNIYFFNQFKVVSRRHWLSFLAGPSEAKDLVQIRAGRFYANYGLNIP